MHAPRPAGLAAWCARSAALLCLAGLLLPPVMQRWPGVGGTVMWLLDLTSHWQWLLLAGLLLFGFLAAWRHPRWALLCMAAPLPWLTAAPQAAQAPLPLAPGATTLSIASANVFYRNHDAAPLLRWVAAQQPDVLVVLELSAAFAAALPGADVYPYRSVEPRGNEFGLAVLSRHPLLNTRVVSGADGIPQIETDVQLPGQRITLAAMHPMPPLTPAFRASLNHKLQSLAAASQAGTLPALVVGDLNATPWSSSFAGLAAMGLRRSTPLAPTWPTPWRGWMGIPIDHVLVSPHWAVLGSERGPDVGSDHLPVLVRLALVAPGLAQ